MCLGILIVACNMSSNLLRPVCNYKTIDIKHHKRFMIFLSQTMLLYKYKTALDLVSKGGGFEVCDSYVIFTTLIIIFLLTLPLN